MASSATLRRLTSVPSVLVALVALILVTGCDTAGPSAGMKQTPDSAKTDDQSSSASKDDDKDDESDAKEKARELAEKKRTLAQNERDLAIARERQNQAELAFGHRKVEDKLALESAITAGKLATDIYNAFKENEFALRIKEAQLDLQEAEDRLKEAEEELQQLEMMYGKDELADKTEEIVINRAKRRIERGREHVENQKEALKILNAFTLPHQLRGLHAAAVEASDQLEKVKNEAITEQYEHQIKVMEAKAEVARLEAETADLKKQIEEDSAED